MRDMLWTVELDSRHHTYHGDNGAFEPILGRVYPNRRGGYVGRVFIRTPLEEEFLTVTEAKAWVETTVTLMEGA